jgi:penicillin-binding protein 1C
MVVFALTAWPGAGWLGMTGLELAARFAPALDPAPYLAAPPSGEVQDRHGALLYAFTGRDGQWCFPRALDQISPRIINATLAAEDRRFHKHPGVDPVAALRALWLNMSRGRVASGASTLTMQLVKRAEATPRSMRGKLGQMFSALRLERSADKRQILETYLNTAPYGGNLVGVEAAARRWFGKPASELVLSEAALLAGLPKSPTALHPLRHPERALARRNLVLAQMRQAGFIDASEYEQATAAPLGVEWHALPHQAPHLAMRLRGEAVAKGAVVTTLDGELQGRVQAMAARHLQRFNGDITNVAVMVLDVGEGSVLARVGSADFFSRAIAGQVDLCRAPRSPGSTLKPFTYALALETQKAYPTEELLDGTLDFGGYNPGNFDGSYNGLVSATEALRLSLNVPAVMLLDRVGVDPLCAFLRKAGFKTLNRPAAAYGLGLTIGDCEVTLESLAGAYLMLARLGEYQPLRLLADNVPASPVRLLSRGTALALYQMLDQPFPAELDQNLVRTGGYSSRVCWKTGTSSGLHDAWTVAFNRHYLVAVWMGNSDGRSSRRLVGAQAALPLAAQVFRGLPQKSASAWPDAEKDLASVKVCAISGLPASPSCGATASAWFPANQYLHRRCAVHQPGADGKVAQSWPADARHWDLAAVPRSIAGRSASAAGEESDGAQKALAITSPANNSEFVLTGESNGDKIQLSSSLDSTGGAVQWYLNDRYVGASTSAAPLYLALAAGTHRVSCMDTRGNTAEAKFTVLGGH